MPKPTEAEAKLEALVVGTQRDLRRFVTRQVGSTHEVDDVVADAYLVAWRRIDDVPSSPDAARAWIFGVARKASANARRARRRQGGLIDRVAHGLGEEATELPECDRLALVAAWTALGEADRQLLLEVGRLGSGRALADALGCSPAAASARVSRARRRLASAIAAAFDDRAV